jgi:protein ImuB
VLEEDRRGAARVAACSDAAARSGISPNLTLSEAGALVDESRLVTAAYDPAADREALRALAAGCEQFSPLVGLEETERAESLFLDIGAVSHLFGGETGWVEQVVDHFAAQRLAVCIAVADTPAAAWAMAWALECRRDTCRVGTAHQTLPDARRSVSVQNAERLLDGRWALPTLLPRSVRASTHPTAIVPPGESVEALSPLPVEALRLPPETVATLSALGVDQIGQLLALARGSLASRFGPELLRRLAEAFGRAEEPIHAHRPPPPAVVEHDFDYPTAHRAALETQLRGLLERLSAELAQREQGVTQLRCGFFLESAGKPPSREREEAVEQCRVRQGATAGLSSSARHISREKHCWTSQQWHPTSPTSPRSFWVEVDLYQASVSAKDLFALAWMRVERHFFSAPVASIRVEAVRTAPLEDRQTELFNRDFRDHARRLARLVDRLTARLGRNAVVGVRWVADAQPELAYRYHPLVDKAAGRSGLLRAAPARKRWDCRGRHTASLRSRLGYSTGTRPGFSTWEPFPSRPPLLLSRPIPLQVILAAPDGVPRRFNESGRSHQVVAFWGPERIETGWWRGPRVGRDYYRVETVQGHRLWVFHRHDDGQWFLHGRFQ